MKINILRTGDFSRQITENQDVRRLKSPVRKMGFSVLLLLLFQLFCFAQDSIATQIPKSTNTPKNLQLSHIEIQEQFIDFKQLSDSDYRQRLAFGEALSQSFDSIVAYYNYPASLNLPHYLNTLTFHFTAIDWKAPHKIKYK